MSLNKQTQRNIDLDSAVVDTKARFTANNPLSLNQYETACESMPGGNTRTVLHFEPFPLTITRGAASTVHDLDKHSYTDFLGEYSAGLYGHSNAKIQNAVRAALDDGVVLSAPNTYETQLAAVLCERFPSVERVRFCNSGTEANLMALNASRVFTGRTDIMVFDGGYHGGVLYFKGGASPINAPYPIVMGQYNNPEFTLPLIEQHADSLAAILIEPMMGGAGCITADAGFLAELRASADRHGIVLIFDEVMTSRLSPGGLQARFGVTPDMTSFGKYLGGGLTFGAFGGREDIMAQFDPRRPDASPHAGTFNNNVLTMSAGLTGLREIYTPDVAIRHNERGDRFRAQLNDIAADRGVPVLVSGLGSLMCVHPQTDPVFKPSDLAASKHEARVLLHLEMLERGYYMAQRGYMSLSLTLEDDDYDGFAAAFDDVLGNYGEFF